MFIDSILQVFGKVFGGGSEALREELRWAGERMGGPRDAEVIRDELTSMLDDLDAESVVGPVRERTLELMVQALEKGEQVKLSGFGVFQVRSKNARMGRNPKTGEPAAIEPRRVIGFRASQVMKARVDRALAEK